MLVWKNIPWGKAVTIDCFSAILVAVDRAKSILSINGRDSELFGVRL